MAKRKKTTQRRQRSNDPWKTVQTSEYLITTGPLPNKQYRRLPGIVQENIDRLCIEAQKHPKQAIPELEALILKYPNQPMLYNYLSVAHSCSGDRKKALEITRTCYQQNPEYLFGRLNYAEFFLSQGDYKKVAEILEYKFDLKRLYPKRNCFHISEVTSFMGLVGSYFYKTGEPEAAEMYYDILKEISPRHRLTKRLKRSLYPNFLIRLLRRLSAKSANHKLGGGE